MAQNCDGCKFLYLDGRGYSDWTWEETWVTCALNLNPFLPVEEPMDYREDNVGRLRWLATMAHECDQYAAGTQVCVSPDGNIREFTDDAEQMYAILRLYRDDNEDGVSIEDCRKHGNVYGRESW